MKNHIKEITTRIKELQEYKQGWYDGVEGRPATKQAIEDAIAFVSSLNWENLYLPYISLAADGEVNFWWDLKKFKLGLGFYGDKTYSYFGKVISTEKKFYGDDLESSTKLPAEILMYLTKD
jgi:hypothetical protein